MPEVTRDPAPSRLSYRLERWWLTPSFRRLIGWGVPVALVTALTVAILSNPDARRAIDGFVVDVQSAFEDRAAFTIEAMRVDGADRALEEEVRALLALEFPVSSFDLELTEMREALIALPRIKDARLRIVPTGMLELELDQRLPIAVWRHYDGLRMIDADGIFVGALASRQARPDLPLVAGDGARDRIGEAMALFDAAAPLHDRLRGLVWVGQRRWDLVLDRDQRIMLPDTGAEAALLRVLALEDAKDLLSRDVAAVDLRRPDRLTVRLAPGAVDELKRLTGLTQDDAE